MVEAAKKGQENVVWECPAETESCGRKECQNAKGASSYIDTLEEDTDMRTGVRYN